LEDEAAGLSEAKLNSKPSRAKAGVPTKRGLGSITVIVAHADIAIPELLQEDNTV
jgi:hypothetical protein